MQEKNQVIQNGLFLIKDPMLSCDDIIYETLYYLAFNGFYKPQLRLYSRLLRILEINIRF